MTKVDDTQGTPGSALITENDVIRSRTVRFLPDLMRALKPLEGHVGSDALLDIGCGFGGLSVTIAQHLGIREIHGIDIDPAVLPEAEAKGVNAIQHDIASERLPYDDGTFDLVTSFGMLDYLRFFDPAIKEIRRVLKPTGFVVISLPNLSAWHTRMALLFGYQPRDVEVSEEVITGIHPYYRKRDPNPTGHIHSVTSVAFRELAEHFGFKTVAVVGSSPPGTGTPAILESFDRFVARRASLAKRFIYVGKNTG